MHEYAVPIIVAVIALAGTVAGILVGYRKWTAERAADRGKEYNTDRQETYREVWDRVESLNVDGRIEEISTDDFSERITALNAYMLKAGIYIDDSDRTLVNDYIKAVRLLHESVSSSDVDEAEIPLGETVDIPEEVLQRSKEIRDTQSRALDLRSEVVARMRTVLTGIDR